MTRSGRLATPTSPRAAACSTAFAFLFFGAFFVGGLAGLGVAWRNHAASPGATSDWAAPLAAGLVFVVVGLGGALWMLRARRQAKLDAARRAELPDEPWRWRNDWEGGRIAHDARGGAVSLSIMALAFIGLSLPAVLAIPAEWESGNRAILVALLFPAVGLGLGAAAARALVQWRRFGRSELELTDVPIVPGRRFVGRVHVARAVALAAAVEQRLTCVRIHVTGSGKNRRTSETILWSTEDAVEGTLDSDRPSGVAVPVSFAVPAGARVTTLDDPSDRIAWFVRLDADLPGVDWFAEFEVPVFESRRPTLAPDAHADPFEHLRADADAVPLGRDEGVHVRPLASGGVEMIFPALRQPGLTLGLSVMALLFGGAPLALVSFGAPLFMTVLIGLFSGLFGLLIGSQALWCLAGTSRVRAASDRFALTRTLLGFGSTHSFDASDVAGVRVTSTTQSGGRGGTRWQDLELELRGGETRSIARFLRSRKEAERLAAELARAVGLERSE